MVIEEKYAEGDIILCTVTAIERATVFVETEDKVKGSIVLSEIAPGRIRNLREYVVPKKVIACKVLKIHDNHLFLSLRRVKQNEKKELIEQYKKEKSIQSFLKKLIPEKVEEIINKIKEKENFLDFFEEAKENPKKLKEYFNESQSEEILKVIKSKKEKEKEIKKEFKLKTIQPDGISRIKKILSENPEIVYIGASRFQIKVKSENLKKASNKLNELLETIERKAKSEKCEFEIKK